MKTILPQDDVEKWSRLLKKIRALLKIRNLLAHAPVGSASLTEWIQDDEGKTTAYTNHFLHISTGKNEQLRGRGIERMDQPDLPDHFTDLRSHSSADRRHPEYRQGFARTESAARKILSA